MTFQKKPAFVLIWLASLFAALPLFPATLDVDGACTLADAITAANDDTATGGCAAGSGADDIRLFQDVRIFSPLPAIANTSELTIHGNGHRIRRQQAAADFRIFEIPGNGQLTLSNVTVSGGSGPIGAGIYTRGTLFVLNSTLSDNHSVLSVGGGAIEDRGTDATTIRDSILKNNSGVHGGAINAGANLVVERSHLYGNLADARGGAIHMYTGQLAITDSTISGNTVTGGPGAPGHNAGGGVFVGYGNATLTNTTLSDNTVGEGNGGGLFNYYGRVTLLHSTLSGNDATSGTSLSAYIADTTLTNSVFSGTCSGYYPPIDGGNNFGCGFNTLAGLDPLLAANGGQTPTHALEAGSTAIDGAGACSTLTDQRRYERTGDCDSGSFEFEGSAPATGGVVAGLDATQAICRNRTSGDLETLALVGATDWDCEAAGVAVEPGDAIDQVVRGVAPTDGSEISGSVTAMRLRTFVCRNLTSGFSTTILQAGLGKSWNCAVAGMTVSADDRIEVRFRGLGE